MEIAVQIEPSWKLVLEQEFHKPYFKSLVAFLKEEKRQGKTIYPPGKLIFNAFWQTPFDKVKVVILGQDPYHNPGQAHGLCFSVPHGIPKPPSLKNIFKELRDDVGCPEPSHGNLTYWARQGVLLLNAILTVRKNEPTSHRGKGWEQFTDAVIRALNEKRSHLVFMLWGTYAQEKAKFVDTSRHLVLKAGHPSPMSQKYFLGCRHFSKANSYLLSYGIDPIDWCIPEEPID